MTAWSCQQICFFFYGDFFAPSCQSCCLVYALCRFVFQGIMRSWFTMIYYEWCHSSSQFDDVITLPDRYKTQVLSRGTIEKDPVYHVCTQSHKGTFEYFSIKHFNCSLTFKMFCGFDLDYQLGLGQPTAIKSSDVVSFLCFFL